METIDQLRRDSSRQREAAIDVSRAAEQLARTANSANARVIPAPVVYDLMSSIRSTLHYLQETSSNLPAGLANSLNDPRIAVYDRDFTGQLRDPVAQVERAATHLTLLTKYLEEAYGHADLAQQAITWQGWDEAEPPQPGMLHEHPVQDSLMAAFPNSAAGTGTRPASPEARAAVHPQAHQVPNTIEY